MIWKLQDYIYIYIYIYLFSKITHLRFLSLGVAIGGGLQGIVAIVNICCYYLFGIPIGLLLGYVAGLEVKVK